MKITHGSAPRYPLFALFTAIALLLCACQATSPTSVPEPTLPAAQPTSRTSGDIILDYSTVAQNMTVETVAAQAATEGGPYWEGTPEYRLLTLQGYPISDHLRKPQIFIYPTDAIASANVNMANVVSDLQALLQTHQAGDHLPFLPLLAEGQMMRAQMQFIDFKNGQGVRFLTQLDQGMIPVNNYELIYTFQGLTSDGKYYVSAILPVSSPELPANSTDGAATPETLNDYPAYLSNTIALLNQQHADSYTPDLNKLDAIIQSIEVK